MPKASQPELLSVAVELPEGFLYRSEFISPEQERALIDEISRVPFSEVKMHGVVARRRTAHFGLNYEYESWRLTPGPPVPEFLQPLRLRLGELTDSNPAEFVEVLLTEYQPGAGIGWHRDARAFGIVVGISLLGECRMRFRIPPSPSGQTSEALGKKTKSIEQLLEPRSAYVLQGPARSVWQHSIPPAKSLRYSITFRTLRKV